MNTPTTPERNLHRKQAKGARHPKTTSGAMEQFLPGTQKPGAQNLAEEVRITGKINVKKYRSLMEKIAGKTNPSNNKEDAEKIILKNQRDRNIMLLFKVMQSDLNTVNENSLEIDLPFLNSLEGKNNQELNDILLMLETL